MEDRKRAKKFLLGGAIIGGIMSLVITLLMDTLFADSLQGTWRDAIAKDLNSLTSIGVSSSSIIVYLLFALILALLSGFGALLGFVFAFFLYKFFSLLNRQ